MALVRYVGMVLMLGFPLVAQLPTPEADFRQTRWGMDSKQVLAAETTPPTQVSERGGESVVRYAAARLAGLDCRIVYIFAQDKLVRTKYVFQRAHENKNDYLADFTVVDAFLAGALNHAGEERVVWRSDTYKKDPEHYGAAVGEGQLEYSTQWNGKRTIVTHALTGANGVPTHEIEYVSVELEPWEDQVVREQQSPVANSQKPLQSAAVP